MRGPTTAALLKKRKGTKPEMVRRPEGLAKHQCQFWFVELCLFEVGRASGRIHTRDKMPALLSNIFSIEVSMSWFIQCPSMNSGNSTVNLPLEA